MDFKSRIPQIFLSLAGLGFICCLSRSDYNLPLFLFIWMMWQDSEKVVSN